MTREEIDKARTRLADAQTKKIDEQKPLLLELLKDLSLSVYVPDPAGDKQTIDCYIQRINTHLQTETMQIICESAEKSCKSAEESSRTAERSCFWAMVAAIASAVGAGAALIGSILTAITVFKG